MKLIVTFAFYFLYWFICFLCTGGRTERTLPDFVAYPDAVQKAVREHPVLGKAVPQEKSIIAILLGNLLLFYSRVFCFRVGIEKISST